jgi:hypothetical protein
MCRQIKNKLRYLNSQYHNPTKIFFLFLANLQYQDIVF